MEPRKRMEILNNFWGYGDPKTARILFIGIEEGGDWSSEELAKTSRQRKEQINNGEYLTVLDNAINLRQNRFLPREQWCEDNPNWSRRPIYSTERKQCALSQRIRKNVFDHTYRIIENASYRNTMFGEVEFQANIFPVASKSVSDEDWENNHCIFGVPIDKNEYYSNYLNPRIEVLSALITKIEEDNHAPYVFIMGKGNIWDCKDRWTIIQLKLFPGVRFTFDKKCRLGRSSDCRIWLTVHPSGRWGLTNNEINAILNGIKEHRR